MKPDSSSRLSFCVSGNPRMTAGSLRLIFLQQNQEFMPKFKKMNLKGSLEMQNPICIGDSPLQGKTEARRKGLSQVECRDAGQSHLISQPILSNPETCRRPSAPTALDRKLIFKGVRGLFESGRDGRKADRSCPQLKMSRDEKQALFISEDLRSFCKEHKLRDKKTQIQSATTLKRIQLKGKQLGCEIRARSQGIELQLIKDKEDNLQDRLNYTFGKDFDRFFRKKLVKESKKCHQQAVSFNLAISTHSQDIVDAFKQNERESGYKQYNTQRMQNYMIAKASQNKKYPFNVKTQLEAKISKGKKKEESKEGSVEESSQLCSNGPSTERMTFYSKGSFGQTNSFEETSGGNTARITSNSKSPRWREYEEDMVQFLEICEFFKKVQQELLRYLPNNHLANKIQGLIDQVEHGEMITRIYTRSNFDLSYFDPRRIVGILKKCPGILSTMNYIVNIIKLNVSGERRKRFKDTEKTIGKFQKLIQEGSANVCGRLKNIEDSGLKQKIWSCLKNASCLQNPKDQSLSVNPTYSDLQVGKEQESELHSVKNRNIICQILKYETMME